MIVEGNKWQKACEVSFDRLLIKLQSFKLSSVFEGRGHVLATIGIHLAIAMGISLKRNTSSWDDQNDSLLGPILCCLLYSLAVCWDQLYIILFVFFTWLLGSFLVFILFRLLGSSHSWSHVANKVGFGLAPLIVALPVISLTDQPLPWFSWLVKCFAVLFASRSASFALVQPSTEKKIFLLGLPLLLLNIYFLSYRSGA